MSEGVCPWLFSEPFPKLLPGMACMPSYVVKRCDKYHLVTNHSSELFALNLLISKDDRAVPLCGLQQFGYMLWKACTASSDSIVIFKSDVSQAYRWIHMSPFWQMLQVVKLSDGQYVINHNNVFGGAASGRCWWSVMALVLWVAREHFGCTNILDYVDDTYSWDYAKHISYYEPYCQLMPQNQVSLLTCFNVLGVTHELLKQLAAMTLPVLGILINGNNLTFTMTPDAKLHLLTSIDGFINAKVKTLRACHALAGYVNWSLNIFPQICLGLASLYAKMSGSYQPNQKVHINEEIVHDLSWLAQRIKASSGVFLLGSIAWDLADCDLEIFMDTSLSGFGMWSPTVNIAFHALMLSGHAASHIFFHEAFVVCCAIHWAADLSKSSIPLLC